MAVADHLSAALLVSQTRVPLSPVGNLRLNCLSQQTLCPVP